MLKKKKINPEDLADVLEESKVFNPLLWIWLSCYLQLWKIQLGQTDIIMLISCDGRMQAVLFLKPTQPVFHSMIQLRPSAQTYAHVHARKLVKRHIKGQDAHIQVHKLYLHELHA